MPKINFNTPFLNEAGEPVMKLKIDEKKTRVSPEGNTIPFVVSDAEGNAIQEPTLIKDMLIKILHRGYPGDDALPFEDKVRRGKLARKISENSSVHYTDKDLTIIKELSTRSSSTMLLTQLDDLMHEPSQGEKETREEKSEKDAA